MFVMEFNVGFLKQWSNRGVERLISNSLCIHVCHESDDQLIELCVVLPNFMRRSPIFS
jgi:hypothetical protein